MLYFEIASPLFSIKDKFELHVCCSELKNVYLKEIKAFLIYKIWYLRKTETWVNNIIYTAYHFHSFTNRFRIYNCISKNNVIYANPQIGDTKPLEIRLHNYPKCPCGNHITCAIYYSIGYKMRTSYPILDFVCLDCVDDTIYHLNYEEIYQQPRIAVYPESFNTMWAMDYWATDYPMQ